MNVTDLVDLEELSDEQLATLRRALLDVIDEGVVARATTVAAEVCTYCRSADVAITVRGAVSIDSADGYTGIDGNGDPVCRECWCQGCEMGHIDVDERDVCEFGVDPDAPPCMADADRLYELAAGK